MRILEIVEATDKTAVFAFGRMNPITIGHDFLTIYHFTLDIEH